MNPLCPCSLKFEDTYHFFMHCQNFSNQWNVLFNELNAINLEILKLSESKIVQVLLFGNKGFTKDMDLRIISSIASLNTVKDLMNHIFLEKSLFHIFSRQKKKKSVSVFYVTYLLLRAGRFNFYVCIVLHISISFQV